MDAADIATRNSSPVNTTSSENISTITRSSGVTSVRNKMIASVLENLSEIAEKLKITNNVVFAF